MILLACATVLAFVPAVQAQDDEDPQTLVGKAAPTFTAPLLGGGEVDLAKHAGKQIVVLDFWATWCPWCRKSTEHFVNVAEKYKDKDVVFYLIAVKDNEERINKYVKENNLKATIVLDPDRKLADPYLVDGIPHIVVIDKEGKITRVAVGEDKVGPAMDEELTKLIGKS